MRLTQPKVKVEGLDNTDITRLGIYAERETKKLTDEWASTVVRVATAKAPVRTGRLKRSIKKTGTKGGYLITVNAPYAVYVEYGTRHRAANPFFKPAIEAANRQFKPKFRTMFKRYKATHRNVR